MRLQKQARRISPRLSPPARKAVVQLLWIHDVLKSYRRYLGAGWDRAIIDSCINAVSPTNPKIASFFIDD